MCDNEGLCYENIRDVDIEEINKKYDEHISIEYKLPTEEEVIHFKGFVDKLLLKMTQETFRMLKKEYHFSLKKSFIFQVFLALQIQEPDIYTRDKELRIRDFLKIKNGRDHSGILSITIFTSPYPVYIDADTGELKIQEFSCKWNCAYCPNEPGQPRSYLKGEPGVLRANRENFDCIKQMRIRLDALFYTGHEMDKLEVNVLGGTWCSYPRPYQEEFIRDMYYSANTYRNFKIGSEYGRDKLSLNEEKTINETADVKVIGLTIETRPDTITCDEIRQFRYYGCTRIQLGIQHIDNNVLKTIRRDCTTQQVIQAIELLKNCGYKIDAHWMPNLPGSSLSLDDWMLNDHLLGVDYKTYLPDRIIKDNIPEKWEIYELAAPDLQVDQWKVYPCTIVPYTDIQRWFLEGKYKPYPQNNVIDLIVKMKKLIFPWIRLNRIIRDIPNDYSLLKDYYSNIRQDAADIVHKDGWHCSCIRCREVKCGEVNYDKMIMRVRHYNASGGNEYFISLESNDPYGRVLYGFIRLRLTCHPAIQVFKELEGCAMIRELHVYGQLKSVTKTMGLDKRQIRSTAISSRTSTIWNTWNDFTSFYKNRGNYSNNNNTSIAYESTKNRSTSTIYSNEKSAQHLGFGKRLMLKAEEIARECGYKKMSIISGEGTRGYYKKLGYQCDEGFGSFMMKNL